jgi:hypothetical protein
MERKVMAVCAVVGFLGVLSAALGFAAEATRVKVRLALLPSLLPLVLSRSRAGGQFLASWMDDALRLLACCPCS